MNVPCSFSVLSIPIPSSLAEIDSFLNMLTLNFANSYLFVLYKKTYCNLWDTFPAHHGLDKCCIICNTLYLLNHALCLWFSVIAFQRISTSRKLLRNLREEILLALFL